MNNQYCVICGYYKANEIDGVGYCNRYPRPLMVGESHFCGEWETDHTRFEDFASAMLWLSKNTSLWKPILGLD